LVEALDDLTVLLRPLVLQPCDEIGDALELGRHVLHALLEGLCPQVERLRPRGEAVLQLAARHLMTVSTAAWTVARDRR
jgi:hypothetical protein